MPDMLCHGDFKKVTKIFQKHSKDFGGSVIFSYFCIGKAKTDHYGTQNNTYCAYGTYHGLLFETG